MNFCALFTVWNFHRHIEQVLLRAKDLFDHVIVLDTGSTDGSIEILQRLNRLDLIELYGYKQDRGAGRDSNFLLNKLEQYQPKWVVKLDHDEYFEDSLADELPIILSLPEEYGWIKARRVTLWRTSNSYRIDGQYGRFYEHPMFRYQPGLSYPQDAIHHMERVPDALFNQSCHTLKSRLIHLSQVDEERVLLQVQRLKEFDKDWSHDLLAADVRLRVFEENLRSKQ